MGAETPKNGGSGVELSIDGLAAGGRGVGRTGGKVWFVKGGVPGDRVLAAPLRSRERFVEARLLRVLSPAGTRREPPCALQGPCGGCPWMVLPEDEQRAWKRRLVKDALARIGRLPEVEVEPVRPSPEPLGYRNRIELSLGRDAGGKAVVGYHAEGSGVIVDVDRCLLLHPEAHGVVRSARRILLEPRPEPSAWPSTGETHRLVVRRSSADGRVLVALWQAGTPFPRVEAIVERLPAAHAELRGIVRVRARPGRRAVARQEVLWGEGEIDERAGNTRLKLPAATFVQVNAKLASAMTAEVVAGLAPLEGTAAFDLFGGVGVHGRGLAEAGARVTVCDADPRAIRAGRQSAHRAGERKMRFVRAPVGRFLDEERRAGRTVERIVANPPRAGLGAPVVDAILATGAARVALVSCDPATLARDLSRFVTGGYRIERVVPFDLFPQTAHVEVVATLARRA